MVAHPSGGVFCHTNTYTFKGRKRNNSLIDVSVNGIRIAYELREILIDVSCNCPSVICADHASPLLICQEIILGRRSRQPYSYLGFSEMELLLSVEYIFKYTRKKEECVAVNPSTIRNNLMLLNGYVLALPNNMNVY